MSQDPLAERINIWGSAVRDFFQAGERATLMSALFNVPARSIVGAYCYYEHGPGIVRAVMGALEPEEIGARMKRVATRPNGVTHNALLLGFFNGREQLRLVRGQLPDEPLPGEDRADLELMLDFWERVARVYVEGEGFLPSDTGYRLPILTLDDAAALADRARPVGTFGGSVRRMMAVTQLYTFILNGESRSGIFHHGPYPLPNGDTMIVKELVGLHDDFLQWELAERPPVPALARVMVLRDVATRIDLYGSLTTDPVEYEDRIVAEALLTPEGDGLRDLTAEELADIERIATDGQIQMYEQAASWSPHYQVAYGADLYAGMMTRLVQLAGLDLEEQIRRDFRRTAERVTPALLSGEEPLSVLDALGSASGEIYSPPAPASH